MAQAANAPESKTGLVNQSSNYSADQTVEKLKNILQAKGVTLFALVDHSGEAAKTGLTMPNTKLLQNIAVVETLSANVVE